MFCISKKTLLEIFLPLIFVLLIFHTAAYGVDYDVRTLTLFNIQQRAYTLEDQKSEFLLYEYIDLSMQDIGREGLSFRAYGWGRGSSDLAFGEQKENGALSYAVLSYRPQKFNSSFQIGRIFSYAGSSFEQFDGFSFSGRIAPTVEMSVFGGNPVNYTPYSRGRGDLIYGARLSTSVRGFFGIGIHYLKENEEGDPFREESGIDLWLKPAEFLDLAGHVFYNNITDNISNYRAFLLLRPHKKLNFSAELSKFIYSDFFFATPLSVFHFPEGEEVQKLKTAVDFSLTEHFSLNANYHSFEFKESDPADRYGIEVRYSFGEEGSCAGVSLNRMEGTEIAQQYDELQSYLFFQKKKFEGSVYLVGTSYDESLFGVKNAYQLLASSGWRIRDHVVLSADVQYEKNPQYTNDLTGIIRLKYDFGKRE